MTRTDARYLIRHPLRMVLYGVTPDELERLRREGWTEVDEDAFRALTNTDRRE